MIRALLLALLLTGCTAADMAEPWGTRQSMEVQLSDSDLRRICGPWEHEGCVITKGALVRRLPPEWYGVVMHDLAECGTLVLLARDVSEARRAEIRKNPPACWLCGGVRP